MAGEYTWADREGGSAGSGQTYYEPEPTDLEAIYGPGNAGPEGNNQDVDGNGIPRPPRDPNAPRKTWDWSWLTNFWNDITGVTAANIEAESALEASNTQAAGETAAANTMATAAGAAAETQRAAAQLAIDEQKRQFAAMQELLKPWVEQGSSALAGLKPYEAAGTDALSRQRALMGLDGADAQRAAIEGISGSPEMTGLVQQGENALLQQGAATGGLRGGNMQGALAQFRPSMLSNLINQQYSKLGGLIDMGQGITMNRAALGQASSAGLAAGGMNNASSLGNLFTQQGGAIAGGQLGAGQALAGGQSNSATALAGGQLAAGQAGGNSVLSQVLPFLAALGVKAATGGF